MDFLPRLVGVMQAGLLEMPQMCPRASLTPLEISQSCSSLDLPWLRCWRDLG